MPSAGLSARALLAGGLQSEMLWTLLSVASRTAAAKAQLRVVTMNIHAWRDSDHRLNFDRLVDQLQKLSPDVVCLNEVLHPFCAPAPDDPYWEEVRARRGYAIGEPSPGSVPDDAADTLLQRLSEAVALPHLVYGAASEGGFFGRHPFGNAVLSRLPLHDVRHEPLRLRDGDLTLGGQERTVANLEPRAATLARVDLGEGRWVGVCVTHLDHMSEELRQRQATEVAAAAADCFGGVDGCPSFLCGDLNTLGLG